MNRIEGTMNSQNAKPHPPWYSPETGIYHSTYPSVELPSDPFLDVVSFLFSHQHNAGTALIDSSSGSSISYTELYPLVKSMASGLHNMGLSKGDVALILLPNSIYYPIIFLGVLYLGAIVTPMNPLNSVLEVKKQITGCNVRVAFTISERVDELQALGIPVIGLPENVNLDSGQTSFSDFYKLISGSFDMAPRPVIKQEDTAAILYSSGTTGMSKGVVLTHRNFIAMLELFARFEASLYKYSSLDNVHLAVLPMFHIYGPAVFVLGCLYLGSCIVVVRKFNINAVINAIDRYKVTHFPVVPPILTTLTMEAKKLSGSRLKSLKQVSCGAAPLSVKAIEDFIQTLPHVDFIQGYAMTEMCGVGTQGFSTERCHNYSSIGLLAPNTQAKVVDWKTGSFLPLGSTGALWLREPGIMKGYLNNKEATMATIDKDGWLNTGDIAWFDQDGYIYIFDRLKELIKYKGFQEYDYVASMRLRFLASQQRRAEQFIVVVTNVPHVHKNSVSDTVDQFFQTNHPGHYLCHQAVYNANKYAKLVRRRERLQNWLDYNQLKFERHPEKRPTKKIGFLGLCGKRVDAIDYYKQQIKHLEKMLTSERQKIIKDPKAILPVAFVSFNSRWGAAVCAQTQQSKNPTLWLADWAPEPRDVYWRNLATTFFSSSVRRLVISLSVFALVFFYMIPNAFVQSLANLEGLERVAPFLRPVIELIPRTIGVSIPMKATFFITYIMVDGWAGIASEILRLKPLAIFHLKNMFLVKTEGDTERAMNPGSVDYPETLPSLQLYFLLGLVYAVVTPILLPFILVFFALAYLVYHHQIINVYNQQYESVAAFWPHVHSRIIASLLISQLLLMGLLSTKKAASSTPLLVVLPILTLAFHNYCKRRFEPAFRKYPLEEAMAKDILERTTEPSLNLKAYLADAYLHPIFHSFKEEEELTEVRVDKHQTNTVNYSESELSSPSPPRYVHHPSSPPSYVYHPPSPPHYVERPSSPPQYVYDPSFPPHYAYHYEAEP